MVTKVSGRKSKQAPKSQARPAGLKSESVAKKSKPVISQDECQQKIAEYAYQIYELRGCVNGNHDQDWQEAKARVMKEYTVI